MSSVPLQTPNYNRRATIATSDILTRHNATLLEDNEAFKDMSISADSESSSGIEYNGWRFRSCHSTIFNEQEVGKFATSLGRICGADTSNKSNDENDDSICINGVNLHIPPMLFGKDSLICEHVSSNITVKFDATDAITTWAIQHSTPSCIEECLGSKAIPSIQSGKRSIVQVPFANQWNQYHINNTTSINSSTTNATSNKNDNSNSTSSAIANAQVYKWDWTFTPDYCCTINLKQINPSIDAPHKIISAQQLSASTENISATPSNVNENGEDKSGFVRSNECGIDRNLLATREDILFYDECLLYQDDLEDCGEITVDVKLRVMPSCWFVLQRAFLRVDGSILHIRDTRIFHRFGDDIVHMELTWREATHETLKSIQERVATESNMPGPMSAFRMNNGSPAINMRDANSLLRFMPLVNQNEGIHKDYIMKL